KKETMTEIAEPLRVEQRMGMEVTFGRVVVTEQVVGYQRKSIRDQSTLDLVHLDMPMTEFETEAVWYLPEDEHLEGLESLSALLGTLHAAEHAMIAILPLWAMCDRWDIGGLSTNLHFQTGRPTVFVYDGHPGGVGIARRGYDELEGWVGDTERLLAGCRCADGCPSCVQSPKCGNLNEFLAQAGALALRRPGWGRSRPSRPRTTGRRCTRSCRSGPRCRRQGARRSARTRCASPGPRL